MVRAVAVLVWVSRGWGVREGRSAPAGGARASRVAKKIRFSPGHFGVSSVARFIELGGLLGRRTISSFVSVSGLLDYFSLYLFLAGRFFARVPAPALFA